MGKIIADNTFTYRQVRKKACLRLFCFPYAGGGASTYRSWAEILPPEIEVCPVQLPGRENRIAEQPFCQLAPLIETTAQMLIPYLDKPFALFGHSMGALIAFELARYLRRCYQQLPLHLLVSARRGPHLPDLDRLVYHLPEHEFLNELRRLQGTPEELLRNAELRDIVLPLLRADFKLCETYQYRADNPLNCPISAFGGTLDNAITESDLTAWQEHTNSRFSLRFFPGNHFFIQARPFFLLQAVTRDLLSHF